MTIKALEWAWEQDIPRSERDVLMVLANAINKDHEFAFPSQETIARKVRMSERHVRRLIQSLVDRELVRIMPGPGKGRGRSTSRYFLACDHHTGETKSITSDLTGGHERPVVSPQAAITGGHERPVVASKKRSQADKGCPVDIMKEPELLPSREGANHNTSRVRPQGRDAVALFAEAADRCNWVKPKGPHSKARQAAVCARLRDGGGMSGWREQIAAAESMPFLGGDNDRGWRMSLDWFIKPANWTKIAEGAYQRSKPKGGANADAAEWRRRVANFDHDGSWAANYGPKPNEPGYLGPPASKPQSRDQDHRSAA